MRIHYKSTFITSEQGDRLYFQIIHDRDDALSKKKIDQERESIPLESDEYISESASILYIKNINYIKFFPIERIRYVI